MKSTRNWKLFSERLNKQVKLNELFAALLYEEEYLNEEVLKEKRHWWKFLSEEVAETTVWELEEKARKISEQFGSETEREAKYCELLKIPSIGAQILGSRLKKQLKGVQPIILTEGYTIRWIYAYQLHGESKIPKYRKVMLKTIRRRKKEGKIDTEKIKLFKRACLIDKHTKDGTPDKYSKELIPVDSHKL